MRLNLLLLLIFISAFGCGVSQENAPHPQDIHEENQELQEQADQISHQDPENVTEGDNTSKDLDSVEKFKDNQNTKTTEVTSHIQKLDLIEDQSQKSEKEKNRINNLITANANRLKRLSNFEFLGLQDQINHYDYTQIFGFQFQLNQCEISSMINKDLRIPSYNKSKKDILPCHALPQSLAKRKIVQHLQHHHKNNPFQKKIRQYFTFKDFLSYDFILPDLEFINRTQGQIKQLLHKRLIQESDVLTNMTINYKLQFNFPFPIKDLSFEEQFSNGEQDTFSHNVTPYHDDVIFKILSRQGDYGNENRTLMRDYPFLDKTSLQFQDEVLLDLKKEAKMTQEERQVENLKFLGDRQLLSRQISRNLPLDSGARSTFFEKKQPISWNMHNLFTNAVVSRSYKSTGVIFDHDTRRINVFDSLVKNNQNYSQILISSPLGSQLFFVNSQKLTTHYEFFKSLLKRYQGYPKKSADLNKLEFGSPEGLYFFHSYYRGEINSTNAFFNLLKKSQQTPPKNANEISINDLDGIWAYYKVKSSLDENNLSKNSSFVEWVQNVEEKIEENTLYIMEFISLEDLMTQSYLLKKSSPLKAGKSLLKSPSEFSTINSNNIASEEKKLRKFEKFQGDFIISPHVRHQQKVTLDFKEVVKYIPVLKRKDFSLPAKKVDQIDVCIHHGSRRYGIAGPKPCVEYRRTQEPINELDCHYVLDHHIDFQHHNLDLMKQESFQEILELLYVEKINPQDRRMLSMWDLFKKGQLTIDPIESSHLRVTLTFDSHTWFNKAEKGEYIPFKLIQKTHPKSFYPMTIGKLVSNHCKTPLNKKSAIDSGKNSKSISIPIIYQWKADGIHYHE